ncbi:O-methyltransferase [Culicoidibacter larvae]|nr:O-methyltransferase [Culicoidibacter larvae]
MDFPDIVNYAKIHDVPIIEADSWSTIKQIIDKQQPKTILEIGSAIGYSALLFAKYSDAEVYTIEKDEHRAEVAARNISSSEYADRIHFYHDNAFTWKYPGAVVDLLFIDAAKAQNKAFFERFEPFVRPGGIILTDNMNIRGHIELELSEIKSRNLKRIVRRTKEYRQWLEQLPGYDTIILAAGDGLALTVKKEKL